MKLKHLVIALSLILATVPAVGFAQDGQNAGTTNARIHLVLVGATACTCDSEHVVVSRRGGSRDSGRAERQPDGGIVQKAVSHLAPRNLGQGGAVRRSCRLAASALRTLGIAGARLAAVSTTSRHYAHATNPLGAVPVEFRSGALALVRPRGTAAPATKAGRASEIGKNAVEPDARYSWQRRTGAGRERTPVPAVYHVPLVMA